MSTFYTILQLVVAISALIIFHEMGHFIVARLFKIKVEEFGLGYPPRMLTLFEFKGTKYTLNWLPFGGFVRPSGENDPSIPGGLANANPWKRIAVYAAGPLTNLLIGVFLYAIIFSQIGAPDTSKVIVFEVSKNSPAEQAGIESGDIFLTVNKHPIESTNDLKNQIDSHLGETISMTLIRNEEEFSLNLVPRENPPEGQGAIGIIMGNPTTPINIFSAFPMGVAATARHVYTLITLPAEVARGAIAPEQARLVGYKGMYDIYKDVRTQEPIPGTSANLSVLGFFTTITISLAILNLFPIPALDGGRILFAIPEILLRRRIPQGLENVINFISFAILIGLFLYINILDFTNPIQLP
ncbi:MAG: site-2 protease family protein [Anaerolineales bacterium]|nr:site-2 protease family protein [Anaerolineales bacterium]